MLLRTYWILTAAAAILAALAGAWAAREIGPPSPRLASGTWLPRPRSIGPVTLVDQRGAPFGDAQLRGAPSILCFGFTHSPDEGPVTLETLARVARSGAVAHLRVLFVTLDPARDSEARLASYVSAFDPRFIALTGSARHIDALAARLGVAFERIELPGGDYTIEQTGALFLLDDAGRLVAVFTPPFDVPRLEQDLRRAAPWLSGPFATGQTS